MLFFGIVACVKPFNPFYHKGFKNLDKKSMVGLQNCLKKPLELCLILRYSI